MLECVAVAILFTLISSSYCRDHGCSSNVDCSVYESCCGDLCKPDHYCLGHSCYSSSDCGIYGSCCGGDTLTPYRTCRINCTSDYCDHVSDCGRQEHCCDNICTLDDCSGGYDASNTIIAAGLVVILTVLVAFSVFFKVFVCSQSFVRHFQRRRHCHYGYPTTTYTEQRIPPPYPVQDPPSYQKAYPDYPPPIYEQLQGKDFLLYQSEPSRTTEAPPPYLAEGESRCSNPTYGAVAVWDNKGKPNDIAVYDVASAKLNRLNRNISVGITLTPVQSPLALSEKYKEHIKSKRNWLDRYHEKGLSKEKTTNLEINLR